MTNRVPTFHNRSSRSTLDIDAGTANRMKRIFALWMAGCSGLAWAAGTAQQNLPVSCSVPNNCTITTTAVAFGAYDPITANASGGSDLNNGGGKVTVTCTKKASGVTIGMGAGLYAAHVTTSMTRSMMANGVDYLDYELYQPPSAAPSTACTFPGTVVWNSTNVLSPASSAFDGGAKDFSVCGTIPKGQNAAIGSYSDIAVATVNF